MAVYYPGPLVKLWEVAGHNKPTESIEDLHNWAATRIVELESEIIRLHSPVHPIPVTLDEAKECIAIFRNSLWDQEVEHRKRHKADADTIKELREKYESTN